MVLSRRWAGTATIRPLWSSASTGQV